MPVKRSSIGWTDFSGGDANPVIGCDPISAACLHCYARRIIQDRGGRPFTQVRTYPSKLGRLGCTRFEPGDHPFRRGPGSRPMVFVVDLGDLFHEAVPSPFIQQVLGTLIGRPDVDWQLLTKRPGRMAWELGYYLAENKLAELPSWIWPGATVELSNYRGRLDLLRQIPSPRRWVSVEPMLEPGVLSARDLAGLAWVICGAESGSERRPFEPWWAEQLYQLCREQGIAFFGKQDSGQRPGTPLLIGGRMIHQFPRLP